MYTIKTNHDRLKQRSLTLYIFRESELLNQPNAVLIIEFLLKARIEMNLMKLIMVV